jgi:ABC-type transport system involved in multi-copper enzyme maturation permease subunit
MSAATSVETSGPPAGVPRREVEVGPVTQGRVITAEWIKFRTLRSTVAVLAAACVGMLVVALLVAYNTRTLTPDLQPDDIVPSSTLQGYYLGQLLMGALGVLFVSGEYSTGMIRSTLAAVPRRLPVLWAKLVVVVGVTLVSMTVMSVVSFLAAQKLLSHYRPGFSLSQPHVLRVVLGTGVYLTLVAVIGSALAWIVRSTPGALVAYFASVLVVPVLFETVLGTWGKDIAQFLPTVAGASFSTSLREPHTLAPWPGLIVMILWAAALVAVAAVRLRRRDA